MTFNFDIVVHKIYSFFIIWMLFAATTFMIFIFHDTTALPTMMKCLAGLCVVFRHMFDASTHVNLMFLIACCISIFKVTLYHIEKSHVPIHEISFVFICILSVIYWFVIVICRLTGHSINSYLVVHVVFNLILYSSNNIGFNIIAFFVSTSVLTFIHSDTTSIRLNIPIFASFQYLLIDYTTLIPLLTIHLIIEATFYRFVHKKTMFTKLDGELDMLIETTEIDREMTIT